MNKKERVIAAIKHESVDFVPCGFSLHFPHDKAFGEEGVKSHLDFFRESDTDIIKIMNENLVPYVGELTSPAEYDRLVRGFSMKSDFMQAQVDFTQAILDRADSTAFSIGTLHGVTASSIHPMEKKQNPISHPTNFPIVFFRGRCNWLSIAIQPTWNVYSHHLCTNCPKNGSG